MNNTLFNTSSGTITVSPYAFAGHNVMVITGSHDFNNLLEERQKEVNRTGNDIFIGSGVWLGSGSILIGPCRIGDHSVIAAGAVVTPGTMIPPLTVYGGIPAKLLREIHQDNAAN